MNETNANKLRMTIENMYNCNSVWCKIWIKCSNECVNEVKMMYDDEWIGKTRRKYEWNVIWILKLPKTMYKHDLQNCLWKVLSGNKKVFDEISLRIEIVIYAKLMHGTYFNDY